MEKRILIAFVLSFAVLYAFRTFYAPPPTAPTQVTESQTAAPAESTPSVEPPPPEPTAESNIQAESVEESVFDTALYTATVSNVGGVLKSFRLKAYTDAEGRAIELVDSNGAGKIGWPLSILSGDAALDDALSKARFRITKEGDRTTLEFAGGDVHARKTFEFSADNYSFSLSSTLTQAGKSVPHAMVWQGDFGDQSLPYDPSTKKVVYQVDAAFKRIALGSAEEPQELTTRSLGLEDQYFLAMFFMPEGAGPSKVQQREFTRADGKPAPSLSIAVPIQSGQALRVYVGPKSEEWLRKVEPQAAAVIDYGIFHFITRPLIVALLWIHSYIGNFGWAIIILTIVINFILFPLRLKQQVSMQKMQKIQPQMRTLQDRYKKLKSDDPRRAQVQAEMMNLYREHGVNPMGGCLPLLLQMPFLFAFWNMLSVSIELRQAPWMLWIHDLSRPDPYFIIPVLMAVSMIITQKMTPTTIDPAQAKIMMIMPVMLTVMFLWVQSGLMLYWLTSNVVGIGQQWFIQKYWSGAPDPKAIPRPAQKQPPAG